MALTLWHNKTCTMCNTVTAEDLPQYTCQRCSRTACEYCGGKNEADEDGNIPFCRRCAKEYVDSVMHMKS
jgi:hypothetical protein